MVKGNTTGGKNYKKSKHTSIKAPYIERGVDQMWARAVKLLGNRNIQCYCNDNKVRICHIRGAMRNRSFVNVGDIVLISCRELAKKEDRDDEKADILAKLDPEHYHRLKGEAGVNPYLFVQMETASDKVLANIKGKDESELLDFNDDDDIFDRGPVTEEKKPSDEQEDSDSEKSIDIDDI
jgi:initiation factor 1A